MIKEQLQHRPLPLPMLPQGLARQSLEEFSYLVAHDLGGPLRRIISFSQLLEEKCGPTLDAQGLHYLEIIAKNGQKAQARLAGLLQYSRLDAASMRYESVDCRQAVNRCLQKLASDIESREALIHVGPLPHIAGDGEQLELLFYCLISNALKFCNDRPDIAIAARHESGSWIFSVRDCGIGIAPKDHEEIFAIFRQLHSDGEYPGAGMGLTLARRIAELHGGEIEVESHPGEGAIFYVILPQP